MMIACGEPTQQELSILQQIRDMNDECVAEAWQEGYDEGWDEAQAAADELIDEAHTEGFNAGLAEAGCSQGQQWEAGYNAAVDRILNDYVTGVGFVGTPPSLEALQELTEQFQDNAMIVQAMTLNYLESKLKDMLR